jgi:PRC-barrel domain
VPGPFPLADVLGAPVCTAGTRVGVIGDVYADRSAEHVVGVEVVGPTGRRWYLPWAAAAMEDGGLRAASPLVFVPLQQVGFYAERCVRLQPRDVDGMTIDEGGVLLRVDAAAPAARQGSGVA